MMNVFMVILLYPLILWYGLMTASQRFHTFYIKSPTYTYKLSYLTTMNIPIFFFQGRAGMVTRMMSVHQARRRVVTGEVWWGEEEEGEADSREGAVGEVPLVVIGGTSQSKYLVFIFSKVTMASYFVHESRTWVKTRTKLGKCSYLLQQVGNQTLTCLKQTVYHSSRW